ncbi:MAG: hypothetical protein IPL18_14600 [Sphingomonadales bacterium]|nr:hypothetical protein [Sphingomonadales bacterium]
MPTPSSARVIRVGPDGDVQKISEAARLANDGDIVEIASGEWHGDVALWEQKQLTIRGSGKRPVLIADGKSAEGKAIWVIRNGNFLIDNIEFRGTRVADGNGAGIRFEGGKLRVSNCVFLDNQNGILTSNNANAELIIERSLFADAPNQGQLLHLLYAGRIASLTISGSRFHSGQNAHLIKSRARKTDIRYNLIFDGPTGTASYEIDLPNGGQATLIGNVIGQSKTTSNPVVVAFGAEGDAWPNSQLVLSHNTLISDGLKPAWFIRTWPKRLPADVQVHTFNNLFSGIGFFDYGLSGTHEGNYPVWSGAFVGKEVLDFRLIGLNWLRGIVNRLQSKAWTSARQRNFPCLLSVRETSQGWEIVPGAYQ